MKIRKSLRRASWAAGLGAVTALALPAATAWAGPIGTQTLDSTATLTDPSSNTALTGSAESSSQVFTIDLPASAGCEGDTASDSYHVFSYLVPQGTNIANGSPIAAGGNGISFSSGFPSEGLGLFTSTAYYGGADTATTTGEVISIPTNFQFAYLLTHGQTVATLTGGTSKVWETGLACANSSGVVTDYWNSVVTFTANAGDPGGNGFTWAAVAGPDPATPEAAWAVTLPIAGVAVLGGGFWLSRRRSRRKALLAHQAAG
jgi:hypothetical protein